MLHRRSERRGALPTYSEQQAAAATQWERLPYEVGAVAAESRLLEETGYKFVVLYNMDVLLPQCAFPGKSVGHVRGGRIVGVSHVSG